MCSHRRFSCCLQFDDEIEIAPALTTSSLPGISNHLAELWDMGFTDEQAARNALIAANGDFQGAVEHLLTSAPISVS